MVGALLNPASNIRAIREIASIVARHRELTWELAKRDLTEKYAGQAIGAFWAFGHPLALMVVYAFLFGVIFKASINTDGLAIPLDYTVYILCGLVPWLVFQEAMTKGSMAISSSANLVKQVVFPIEVLPVKTVLASAATEILYFLLLAFYIVARFQALPWTFVLVVPLIMFQLLAMIGIGYLLSAAGAYLRDTKDFVTVFALVNVYMMPVVYLPDWVPAALRPILYINPFSYMIWCYQDAVFFGRIEHPWAWVIFPTMSVLCFALGYRTFRSLKSLFGNVL